MRPPLSANLKYRANPWTGDDRNTCRVFNNGHNLWKNISSAWCFTWNILYVLYTGSGKCEQLLPNVSREILSAIWGRCGTGKTHSPRTVLPEQTGIGIRPICFTWNNWESKHDNTKLGVNVRSKVKKHCGGTKLSAGTGQGSFIKEVPNSFRCAVKLCRCFDRACQMFHVKQKTYPQAFNNVDN